MRRVPDTRTTIVKVENESTYVCPGCKASVWGKPGLDLNCNRCRAQLVVRSGTEDAVGT